MLARRFIVWSLAEVAEPGSAPSPPLSGRAGDPGSAAGLAPPLWVSLAGCLLDRAVPNTHPALAIMTAGHASAADVSAGCLPGCILGLTSGIQLPPGPLRRMVAGIFALQPGLRDVVAPALTPGPWVAHLPLWGNPLLQFDLMSDVTVLGNHNALMKRHLPLNTQSARALKLQMNR